MSGAVAVARRTRLCQSVRPSNATRQPEDDLRHPTQASNVGAFVVPVAGAAHAAEDKLTLAAIATFVIAAVPIGPDRHACLLGVRKENIFHYLIGAAAIMFAEAF